MHSKPCKHFTLSFEWNTCSSNYTDARYIVVQGLSSSLLPLLEKNCFACHRPNTKYSCVACAVTICDVCSVLANEDDLGYSENNEKHEPDWEWSFCSACKLTYTSAIKTGSIFSHALKLWEVAVFSLAECLSSQTATRILSLITLVLCTC